MAESETAKAAIEIVKDIDKLVQAALKLKERVKALTEKKEPD